MSCCAEIHVDDVGTSFVATIKDENCAIVDISAYDDIIIKFAKPDGTTISRTASLLTDGLDGKMFYTTVSGDIDMEGLWELQGVITIGPATWNSSIHKFTVNENI